MNPTPTAVPDHTISQAKAGNHDALGEIFRTYQPALLRYLRVRAGSMAEDVASQTWISVAKSIPRFEGDGTALRGWILTIGRRRLADEFRRMSRRPQQADEQLEIIDFESPEEIVTSKVGWAQRLLRQLPPQQADVVMLRVIGGLSVDEVASEMRLSAANVRVLSHRGLAKLQELVRVDPEVDTGVDDVDSDVDDEVPLANLL